VKEGGEVDSLLGQCMLVLVNTNTKRGETRSCGKKKNSNYKKPRPQLTTST